MTAAENEELRAVSHRIRLLEQQKEVLPPLLRTFPDQSAGKIMYPIARELATSARASPGSGRRSRPPGRRPRGRLRLALLLDSVPRMRAGAFVEHGF